MKSRHQSQAPLPPMEVRKADQVGAVVRKSDQEDRAVRNTDREASEALAATMFSAALDASGITRDEAGFLMGGISRSLVDKMCSPTERQCPSLIQLLLLPPSFHIALIQELDKHFGLGRAMLARVQQSLGALGLLVR